MIDLELRTGKIKMKKYILCEGTSDLAFISLYLEKKLNYKFNKTKTDNRGLDGGQTHIYFYSNDDSELMICSAGGCSRMELVFNKYLKPLILRLTNDEKPKFVIIMDSDDNGDKKRKADIDYDILQFKNEIWNDNQFLSAFGENVSCPTFLRIIPVGEDGAFEDLLLKVFANEEPVISDSVKHYYNNMSLEVKKNIKKHRLEIKSRLNCVINLIDPESTFKIMSDAFEHINIDSEIIKKNYSFLCDL